MSILQLKEQLDKVESGGVDTVTEMQSIVELLTRGFKDYMDTTERSVSEFKVTINNAIARMDELEKRVRGWWQ